jgi:hypothetical protein
MFFIWRTFAKHAVAITEVGFACQALWWRTVRQALCRKRANLLFLPSAANRYRNMGRQPLALTMTVVPSAGWAANAVPVCCISSRVRARMVRAARLAAAAS